MKKLLTIFLLLVSIIGFSQKYKPSDGTPINKPISPSLGIPQGQGFYYDSASYKWSDFVSTAEMLAFYPATNKSRSYHFAIYASIGGTRTNGIVTGGTFSEYWFKNGQADSNLVVKVQVNYNEKIRNVTTGQKGFYTLYNTNSIIVFQRNGIRVDPDLITQNVNGVTYSGTDIVPTDVIILQYIPNN